MRSLIFFSDDKKWITGLLGTTDKFYRRKKLLGETSYPEIVVGT